MDVGVALLNSTAIRVTWAAVKRETVRGKLLGYKVLVLLVLYPCIIENDLFVQIII